MEELEQIEEDILKTTNFLSEAYLDNYQKLENKFKEKEKRIIGQVVLAMQEGIDQAVQMQQAGKKEKIKYISLSILLSSILTQEYSIGIDFYDKNFYLDEETVFTEIKIDLVKELINQYVEKDIKNLKIYQRQEKTNYPENEYIEIRKLQSMTYMLLYMKCIIENIQKAVKQLEIKNMQTEGTVDITYGLYLEKQEKIYQWEV